MEDKQQKYLVLYQSPTYGTQFLIWAFPAKTVCGKSVPFEGFGSEAEAIEGIKSIPTNQVTAHGKVTFFIAKVEATVEIKPVFETKITRL